MRVKNLHPLLTPKIPTNLPLSELKALLERERGLNRLTNTLTKSIRAPIRPRLRAPTLRRKRRKTHLNILIPSNLGCPSDQEGGRGRARSTMKNTISKSNCQTHPAHRPQPSSSAVPLRLQGNRGVLVSHKSRSRPNREKRPMTLLPLNRMMTITLRMTALPQTDYTLEVVVKVAMASDLGKRMAWLSSPKSLLTLSKKLPSNAWI